MFGDGRYDFNKVVSVRGMKSSVQRKTQQRSKEVPSFSMWRSFNRTAEEDMSNHGSCNILLSFHIHSIKIHLLSINNDVRCMNNDEKNKDHYILHR